ncbi:kelch-like protein 17 [Puma concolor]|uniref:Kelch-like protein 17 n=1 Tax=Puma concolor TaxID=9696 RepID=A0A6P6GW01_PUMCO|nr:kelch-like protein 17 [Puma concolor]
MSVTGELEKDASDQPLRVCADSFGTPRSTHDLVAMDGWLYAVGGNDGSSSLNSIEKYNPRTNKWVAASCMFTRRSSVGAAVLELLNFPPPSSPTLSVSSTSL